MLGTITKHTYTDAQSVPRIRRYDIPIEFKPDSLSDSGETIILDFYFHAGAVDEATKQFIDRITLTLNDDVRPQPKFSKSSVTIDEGGMATYGLSLMVDPGSGKTTTMAVHVPRLGIYGPVTVRAGSGVFGASATLSFTGGSGGTWNSPQTVTLDAGYDWEDEDFDFKLLHVPDGGPVDSRADELDVNVRNVTAGVLLSTTALTLNEGEETSFTVSLIEDPQSVARVSVAIPKGQEKALTLTSSNSATTYNKALVLTFAGSQYRGPALPSWENAQTITVLALHRDNSGDTIGNNNDGNIVDDRITLSTRLGTTTHPRTSAGLAGGIDDAGGPDLLVTTRDKGGAVELSPTSLSLNKGAAGSYKVRMTENPGAAVTVTVDVPADDQDVATIQGPGGQPGASATLSFDAANWNEWQTLKVTARADSTSAQDEAFQLTHTAGGFRWRNATAPVVDVSISPATAAAGLTLSKTDFELDEPDGFSHRTTSATYTVVLKTDPGGTATVTPTSSHTASVTVSPASLSFDSKDWNQPQAVTITAVADANVAWETVTISHPVSGYGDVTSGPEAEVLVTDTQPLDPNAAVEFSATHFVLYEPGGGDSLPTSATYTVVLKTDPGGTATVTPTSSHTASVTVSPASLSFDSNDWSQPKTFTITALTDADSDSERLVAISHMVRGYTTNESPSSVRVIAIDAQAPVTGNFILSLHALTAGKEPLPGATDPTESRIQVTLTSVDRGYRGGLPPTPFRLCYHFGSFNTSVSPADVEGSKQVPTNCFDHVTRRSAGDNLVSGEFKIFDIVADQLDESREDVEIRLLADPDNALPSGVTIGQNRSRRVSVADSNPTSISLLRAAGAPASIAEGGGKVGFSVRLSRALLAGEAEEVRVPLVASGTGIEASDYAIALKTATGATLSASAPYTLTLSGIQAAQLELAATADSAGEGATETLTLALGAATSNLDTGDRVTFDTAGTTAGTDNSLSVDIIENINVGIAAGDDVTEGGEAVFKVTASPPPAAPLTVNLAIAQTGAFVAATAIGTDKTVVIPIAGSATYKVATVDDSVDEVDGAVTATLAAGDGYVVSPDAGKASVSVADDEATSVSLSAPASVAEGSPAAVTATLGLAQAADVAIPISASVATDDTAEAADFKAPASITVTAGATTGSAEVATVSDVDKDDETFTVALGSPLPEGFEAGAPASVQIGITDDGLGATVSLSAAATVKDTASATITATLSHAFAGAVTVPISVAGSGASPAESTEWDAPASIVVAGGATTADVDIDIIRDLDKDDETFTVSLGTLPADLSPGATTDVEITITDDGLLHKIALSADPDPVDEGASTTITATADGFFDADTVIPLTFTGAGGSAAEDGDFQPPSPASVTIKKDATSGTVTLAALGDRDEDDETVRVALGTPLPAGVLDSPHLDVGINDTGVATGPTLTLTVSPTPDSGRVAVTEGDSVTLAAALDEAWSADLTLGVTLDDGTADSDDYSTLTALTIPAGQTSATASITITDDEVFEGRSAEYLTMSIDVTMLPDLVAYESDDYIEGSDDDSYSIYITDNDKPIPTIGIEPDSSPGQEGDRDARFNFSAGGAVPDGSFDVKVKVEQTGDFLTTGQLGAQTVTMSGISRDWVIAIADDNKDEPNGTVTVTLLDDAAYKIDAAKKTATLVVEDRSPTPMTLSAPSGDIKENGGRKDITVSLGRALVSGEEIKALVELGFGGASHPGDFTLGLKAPRPKGVSLSYRNSRDGTGQLNPVLTFTGASGASASATLALRAVDDRRSEDSEGRAYVPNPDCKEGDFDERPFVNLCIEVIEGEVVEFSFPEFFSSSSTGLGGGVTGSGSVKFAILDNDSSSTDHVTVAPGSLTVAEGNETDYFVVLDTEPAGEVTVTTAVSSDAATVEPEDLTFDADDFNKAQKITVTAVDDKTVNSGGERTATINHTVSGYGSVTTADPVTVTVQDVQTGLTATPASLAVPISQKRSFTVQLKSRPSNLVNVGVTSGDAAVATVSPAALAFLAADWNQPQTIEVTGVKQGKANITATVTSNYDPNYFNKSVTVPVTVAADNRPTVELGVDAGSVAEGTSLALEATLSAALGSDVSIPLTYTNGSAEDADYTKVASIAIAKGATEGTANLATVDNAVHEGDETLTVALGALPSTVRKGVTTEQAVTITDAADLPTLTFATAAQTVGEDAGTLTLTLDWAGTSEREQTLGWATADGTATLGADYTAASGTITRAASATAATTTIDVSVKDDAIDDAGAPETFTVTLSSPVNAKLGAAAVHTVSITDNDPTPVRLTASKTAIAEAAGTKTISVAVVRNLEATETLPVPLAFSGAATFGTDYAIAAPSQAPKGVSYSNLASTDLATNPPTVTFTGGSGNARTAGIVLTATQDTTDEGAAEGITVALGALDANSGTGLGGGALARPNEDSATFDITDDDGPPSLAIAGGTVDEGAAGASPTLAFTVTLSAVSGRDITVDYADAGSGTATSGTDYTAITAGTLSFKAGETSKTVDVTVTGDIDPEPGETVVLRLSSPTNAVFPQQATTLDGTGTITNDDVTPEVGIAGGAAVDEGGRPEFTVTSHVAPAVDLTVALTVTQQGNFVDDRYLSCGPVTIKKGSKSASCNLATQSDTDDEADGSVTATIADGGSAYTIKADAGSASVTVRDRGDPTPVSLTAGASTQLVEGDAGTSAALTLGLGRALAAGEIVEVPLAITSATGVTIAGAVNRDYTLTATGDGVSLTGATTAAPRVRFTGADAVSPMSAGVVFTATARDDGDADHETFTVAIGNLADSALATNLSDGARKDTDDHSVDLGITDDEGAKPLLNLATADGESAPTEGQPAHFKLTLAPTAPETLSVGITVAEAGGLDYIAKENEGSRTLTVPAGESSFEFSVPTVANKLDQDPGGVLVTLVAGAAYRIGNQGAHTIVVHDDEPTEITLARSDGADPIAENGGVAVLEFALGKALAAGDVVTIPLSLAGAAANVSLGVKSGQTGVTLLTANPWSAGQPALQLSGAGLAKGVVEVTALPNTDTANRTLTIGAKAGAVTGTGPSLGGGVSFTGSSIAIVIRNDDGTPELRIEAGQAEAFEGRDFKFLVSADPVPATELSVEVHIAQRAGINVINEVSTRGSNSQADGPGPHTLIVTFAANRTTPVDIDVVGSGNSHDDPSGWVSATLQAGKGYTVAAGAGSARTEVYDDDGGPTVSIAAGSGVAEGGKATFTLKRSERGLDRFRPVDNPQVRLKISQVGEFVDPAQLGIKQLTFSGNSRTLIYEVPTLDDSDDEPDGRIVAELQPCARLQNSSSCAIELPPADAAEVAVTDNEADVGMVNIRGGPLSLTEGGAAGSYEVSLQTDPGQAATVRVDVPQAHRDAVAVNAVGGTAGASATLSFTSGTTGTWDDFQTVTVSPLVDDDGDDADTIALGHTVTGYPGVTSAPDVSVTVADYGYAVLVDSGEVSLREHRGTATYGVRLRSAPAKDVTVTPVSGDTAAATVSGPLTFTPSDWKSHKTVTVTGVEQASSKVTITHTVTSADPNYTNLAAARVAAVKAEVTRDTRPVATLSAAPNPVAEGADVTLTATLDKAVSPARAITIPLTYTYGTAAPADVTEVASVTIASGATTGTATLGTVDDTAYEKDNETFTVEFGTLPDEVQPGATLSAALAIDDAEAAPRVATLSATPASVEEGNEVTVTVTLDKALTKPARAVTIPLEYTLGTAEQNDFAQVASITVPSGASKAQVRLAITDDDTYEGAETFTVTLAESSPPEESLKLNITSEEVEIDDSSDLPTLSFLRSNEILETVKEDTGALYLRQSGKTEVAATVTFEIKTHSSSDVDDVKFGKGLTATVKGFDKPTGPYILPLPVIDDDEDETRESFALVVDSSAVEHANWVGSALPKRYRVVRIIDDDPTPVTLTPGNDLSLDEQDATSTASVTLTLQRALVGAEAAVIPLKLTTSTAAALPGSTSADFTLGVSGNGVTLLGAASAKPRVRIVGAGRQTATVTFTSSGGDDGDYQDEVVKVAFGDISTPNAGTRLEGGLSASDDGDAMTEDNVAILTIVDDDEAPPGFELTVNTDTVTEDVSAAPTITVTAAPIGGVAFTEEHSVTVSVGAADDTAVSVTDYAAVTDFTITVPANQASATGSFTLTPVNDAIDELDETLSVTGVSGDLDVRPATVAITDDDPTPTVTLALAPAAIDESGDANASTVTASSDGLSSEAITLEVSAAPVDPAVAGDLALSRNATLTIAAGSTASAGTVTLTAADNDVDAADKTFTVSATIAAATRPRPRPR